MSSQLDEVVLTNMDKRSRTLTNEGIIEELAKLRCPQKLKFKVLEEVFTAFFGCLQDRDLTIFSQSQEFRRKDICFEYDKRIWCGTVDCRNALYNGRNVVFTKVKLPNDGFIYTQEYCDPSSSLNDDIVNSTEVSSVINAILDVILPSSNVEKGDLMVNYKPDEHRLELYQFNLDGSKCLSVMFENGTYMHYTNKGSFNRKVI